MKIGELLIAYPLATVLQLPFQIIMAAPLLLLTLLLSWATQRRLSGRGRLVLLTGLAAVGLAPIYGHHYGMLPAYMALINGVINQKSAAPTILIYFVISWAATWGVLLLGGLGIARYRQYRTETRSNKEPEGTN